ncbi:MAG: hypothetical protein JWP89_6168 [Schlesneria sp.]|nr:hypothetical protein [Schlesneria sp.]
MTTESLEVALDARRWAFRTLDFRMLSTDCSCRPSDITWLLTTIAEAEYQLPSDQVNAAQIVASSNGLTQSSLIDAQASIAGRYHECWRELADFKNEFFELTINARSRRWQTLSQRCVDFPDLVTQLNLLEPGLETSFPSSIDDARQRELLQICRDVFLASAPIAARIRRTFCNEWRADPETWEKVVDDLLMTHGRILETIAPWIDVFGDELFYETGLKPMKFPLDQNHLHAGINRRERQMTRTSTHNPQSKATDAPGVLVGTLWIWLTVAMIIITAILLLAEDPAVTPVGSFPVSRFGSSPFHRLR